MDLAVFLTQEETQSALGGDNELVERIRTYAKLEGASTILGKDDDGILYDISGEILCAHTDQYVNDRNQSVCKDCGEELGR